MSHLHRCSPKAGRYDHIRSLTAFAYLPRSYPSKHRLLSFTGVLLEYVIIFAGEKSGLGVFNVFQSSFMLYNTLKTHVEPLSKGLLNRQTACQALLAFPGIQEKPDHTLPPPAAEDLSGSCRV